MANITEILGTDSLSSSRITLNENFNALNDDIFNLVNLVDIDNSTIQNVTSINSEALTLEDGATSIFNGDATSINIGVSTSFNGEANSVTVEGLLIQDSVKGSFANPYDLGSDSSGSLLYRTYFINTGTVNLPAGVEGQEVTFISANDTGIVLTSNNNSVLGGFTAIQLGTVNSSGDMVGKGSTVTLRFLNGQWSIIAEHRITVTA